MAKRLPIYCIACSIFKDALNQMQKESDDYFTIDYISSMLHMNPKKLEAVLEKKIVESQAPSENTLLLFGDCHPYMDEQVHNHQITRVEGINCAEILLGKESYRKLRNEGAFFLMPEWTGRWREVFQQELGLDNNVAKEFMSEMHRILVYLDLGTVPVPRKILREVSEYTGLPVKVIKVQTENLRQVIENALNKKRFDIPVNSSELEEAAYQSMALDMVENVLHQADNPDKLQTDIAIQMRGLTGAHAVILIQFSDDYSDSGYEIVHVEPDRRREIVNSEAVPIMVRETRSYWHARVWEPESVEPKIGHFLRESGFDLSIAVPLHVGKKQVGSILLLGLPDDNSIGTALNMLDLLATIIALIFRNALLFKKQEEIIEHQTHVLRESETKYRSLFQNMLNAFAYHQIVTDAKRRPIDYIFLEVNDMYEKQTGLKRADIIGKRVTEVIPGIKKSTTNWIGLYGKVALEGQELRIEQYDDLLQKWFSILVFCPAPGFFSTIFEDITERKRNEAIIRNSELKFRELFNHAGDAIIIHDLKGRFIEVNDIASKIFGYSRSELLGMNPNDIDAVPNKLTGDLRIEAIKKKGAMVFESIHKTKHGEIMPVEINSRLIDYEGKEAILSIVRDISERKHQEVQLEFLLKQKEVLLKEVYHRVKNNFMIVSSLLHLQSSKIKDETSKILFQESRDRVQSMALIHQQLYRSVDLASVDFKSFIQQLSKNLYRSYVSNPSRIQLKLNLQDIPVGVDKAIPCGLIVNELLTNAFKYAFPDQREGIVGIEFKKSSAHQVKLLICDDGVGLPPGTNFSTSDSLGMQIVDMLTQQIKGKLSLKTEKGTCVTIIFPNQISAE